MYIVHVNVARKGGVHVNVARKGGVHVNVARKGGRVATCTLYMYIVG